MGLLRETRQSRFWTVRVSSVRRDDRNRRAYCEDDWFGRSPPIPGICGGQLFAAAESVENTEAVRGGYD